ncbi:MAG: HAD-IA family hydrolase [Acidobacteriota bacterium]
MPTTPRLVVFDWDGTLVDSIGAIEACALRALEDLGRTPPDEHAVREVMGLGLDLVMARLLPDGDRAELDRLIEGYRHHWLTHYRHLTVPFGASRSVLEALTERELMLGVATGKGRRGLDHDLDTTGFRPFFHATRTADEAPSKPHPQMLLDVLDELGVRPKDALMVGDTTFDLDMARSARVPAVAVTSGHHEREALLASEPVACLSGVGELIEWFDRELSV